MGKLSAGFGTIKRAAHMSPPIAGQPLARCRRAPDPGRVLPVLAISFILPVLAACGRGAGGGDDRSTPPPRRIVSLVPSMTEVIHALGAGDRLVGRCHWCDFPPEVAALPDLGRFESISKERILDLRPDLVIVFPTQKALVDSLRGDFGLRVLAPPTEDREKVYAGIAEVAGALGLAERGAETVRRLREGLQRVRDAFRGRPPVRVLVVLDRNPLYVPGTSSFVDDLLTVAGAENVAARPGAGASAWPTASLEQVLDWDPKVIVDLSVGEDREATMEAGRAFWNRLPRIAAVRDGRVHFMDQVLLVRPGPRMVEAAELLARLVHGS